MKKILIIADRDLGYSGVPAVIMSIVRGLHSKYIFDIVVFEETDSAFAKEFISYGGKIIRFKINKPKSIFKKIYFYLSNYSKQVFREFQTKITISDYFIVHSFKGIFSAPFLEFAKKHGIKKRILHINGVYDKNPKAYLEFLNRRNKRKCINFSNVRLAVSDDSGRSFFRNDDYQCIFNPINDGFYKKMPPFFERLTLTQIGTYSDRKNQLFTVKVFKKIMEQYPNATLNFLGYEVEPGYLDRIKALVKEYGFENSVHYFEQTYNQIELLKKTTICLFPSKSEAFGLVAVENQACNRPVICSQSIIKEVNCGGAIFIDFDAVKWAEVIIDVFVNRKLFNIDTSKFNNKSFCKTMESIYKDA